MNTLKTALSCLLLSSMATVPTVQSMAWIKSVKLPSVSNLSGWFTSLRSQENLQALKEFATDKHTLQVAGVIAGLSVAALTARALYKKSAKVPVAPVATKQEVIQPAQDAADLKTETLRREERPLAGQMYVSTYISPAKQKVVKLLKDTLNERADHTILLKRIFDKCNYERLTKAFDDFMRSLRACRNEFHNQVAKNGHKVQASMIARHAIDPILDEIRQLLEEVCQDQDIKLAIETALRV